MSPLFLGTGGLQTIERLGRCEYVSKVAEGISIPSQSRRKIWIPGQSVMLAVKEMP
jgi:hypothetical protein